MEKNSKEEKLIYFSAVLSMPLSFSIIQNEPNTSEPLRRLYECIEVRSKDVHQANE